MEMKVLLVVALEQELSPSATQLLNDNNIDIVYSGVGKVNAALSTYTAIKWYNPDIIFNYGTAGAVGNTTGLVEVTELCQRDMLPGDLGPRGITPFAKSTELFLTNQRDGLRCGTGDSFVSSKDDWLDEQVDVVDMEAWAIARAASIHGVPWRSYKYISDNTNDDSAKAWLDSVAKGSEEFTALLLDFVN